MTRSAVSVVAVVLLLGSAIQARAEGRPSLLEDHKPSRPNAAFEFELGYRFYKGDGGTAHFLVPSLDFRYAFSQHAELTFNWPLAFYAYSPDVGSGDSSFKSGNPSAVLYYDGHLEQGYFRIGGGVAFPVAHLSGGTFPIGFGAYNGAAAMNGLYNLYRYAVDTLSLIVPAQLELRSGALVFGGDTALIVLVPTGDNSGPARANLQLGGLLGGRIDNVTVGARLQVAWLPSQIGDNAQASLVPFVQGDFSGGGFIYARLVLNLDGPLGIFRDARGPGDAKVWGLFIGGGARF